MPGGSHTWAPWMKDKAIPVRHESSDYATPWARMHAANAAKVSVSSTSPERVGRLIA